MGNSTSEKRLIFVRQNYTPFGGAERYLERVCNQLEKNGIKYEIIHSHAPKWLPSWLKALLFDIQVCKNKGDRFYFSLDRISCPDIYRAGDGVHKAYLRTKSFSFNPLHPVYLYLEKRCFKNAGLIIANSKMVKEQIIRHYNINSNKIKVIYNGIPVKEKLPYAKKRLSKEFKFDIKDKIILFVGSGFERKGVRELLIILSKIKHNFTAFIVGNEKKMAKYIRLSESLCPEKRVIFTGPRKDVDLFYSAGDLFLFPTHYDPFSNSVLEAMSFENAVFTTRQNGVSEIINQEFIMNPPNDFSVVEKLNKLLCDDSKLQEIKMKNYKIAQNFSIEKNVAETLKYIDRISQL